MPEFLIRPLGDAEVAAYEAHFARHQAESGRGDYHFMPFAPDDLQEPTGLKREALKLSLDEIGWQRWWVAGPAGGNSIVGHVDVKGDFLKTGLHRCELGIGIERAWRGQGLGRQLMAAAIEFARAAPSLCWLDLRVFGHNANARALYQTSGFVEVGVLRDRFRIEGEHIDDVIMTLDVSQPAAPRLPG